MVFIKDKGFDKNKKASHFCKALKAPLTVDFSNQTYLDFKKLYDLKPVLEDAGLYPIINNNQQQARI